MIKGSEGPSQASFKLSKRYSSTGSKQPAVKVEAAYAAGVDDSSGGAQKRRLWKIGPG